MRLTRAAVTAATLSIMLAGCGAGPSDRPVVAVERPGAGGVATQEPATEDLGTAEVPKSDLTWRDCTESTISSLAFGDVPAGLVLECADFSTPIDTAGTVLGTFRAGALRARLPETPTDVAPLVLTSGADRSSASTLAGLAVGPNRALLTAQPVVAVDRRGIGASQPIDCIPAQLRAVLTDLGQTGVGNADQVGAVAGFSQDATIACRDFLQPYEGTFDAPHAADDIEQLRKQWQVEKINLLGAGNGGKVALSYARRYGDHLARLVLDAPEPVGADAATMAEARVTGAEAALTAFAQRCKAANCALGPDPRATVVGLMNKATAGGLGEVTAADLATALTGFLSSPRGDQNTRVTALADILAAADRGDRGPLIALVGREAAAISSDGEFVNRCTDSQQPPTPDRARELADTWAGKYPVFGRTAAIGLMVCSAWPVSTAPPLPDDLSLPVLVFAGAADPVVGGAAASVTGALGAAGARHATMTWQGWGHPVVAHSGCAQQAVNAYLAEGKLPADGGACPA
ncbi:alpha/beta hydrolase [Nocardia ignorata]|uniref:Alpha/beta hydrolase family protein n=1 Tax=Nocardia ignorata TaxID=145285 RepID=A0A4R6PTS7_NOCIG|nr:alpha/beta hydrolase [Nocardia ignorata]TDP41470.1 alpha/beta hydrolase family protein [Nocardia ignorata]